jgi:hypothetical protein
LIGALAASLAQAQQTRATVTGVVTDPTGALVTNATVILHSARTGEDITAATRPAGRFTIAAQPDTAYILTVAAAGFATYTSETMQFPAGKTRTLDVRLAIAEATQLISVTDDNLATTDPNRNGDSLTFKGSAIDQLPLDSAELLQQLQAISGGPNPDIYINGFSGGALPPRDTIREIRINQNPYSAQYDTTPGNGRIEIFTKPGTEKFHGDLYTFGNASQFNTRDPFNIAQPSYYSYATYASLGGPINKHMSFFSSGGRTAGQDNALINAQTLDTNTSLPVTFHQAISAPSASENFSTRLDTAFGTRSTFIARYSLGQSNQTNGGVGQLALATQAFAGATTTQTLQLSNSQILSPKIVNDTRFQYTRIRDRQTPASTAPTIVVSGAFTGGGNSSANYNDNQDRYELQNYVSMSRTKQFFTFGGRFRSTRDASHSLSNYNGTYVFNCIVVTSDCISNSYQQTSQGPTGGTASQFSITKGDPNVAVTVADTGLFLQDDWKARPNLTLSGGLRFESQNHIADHADWAPRFGIAWTPSLKNAKPSHYTIRGGAGIFYHRFASANVLQAERQNGITQQQFIMTQPTFFYPASTPSNYELAGAKSQSTIYQISPTFHSPYFISTTASVERRFGNHGTVTASWIGIHGVHNQLTQNINAPLPGTYNPAVPSSGTRPLGGTQNIYQYSSEGVLRTNRVSTNFYLNFHDRLFTYGSYQFLAQNTDANETFASNSYNIAADYGRASTDIRHQASLGISATLPFHFRAYTFISAHSGAPFNITLSQDLNGDSIFNDRPAFATDLTRPSVVKTQFGTFDTSPIAGQTIIPINYGRGPGYLVVNFNIGKTFTFGPALKPPPGTPAPKLAPGQKPTVTRRFSLDIGVDGQNLFNQVNLGQPVGTLGSPLFGKSISLANGNNSTSANRIVEISTYLRF